MKCETCNKEFHYCSSCSFEISSYLGYCSDNCMKNSKEWIDAKNNTVNFLKNLSISQQKQFKTLLDDYDKFEYFLYDEIEYNLIKDEA